MIKLIALDLDDTLLMPDCTIPDEVVSVLRAAAGRGVDVVIATGRIYPSAKLYAGRVGSGCPIICYNGAMIRRIGEKPLYTEQLDPGLMHRIALFCKERDLYLQMYDQDDIVVEKICEATLADPDAEMTEIRVIRDLTKAELAPSPKMMILDDPGKIVSIERELKHDFGEELYIAASKDYLLEMMPKGVSKKNSLARYAQSRGIRREEVMACGDNTNDIEMVEWAGTGVAVANAVPQLKAAAAYVAVQERSYGVAEAVKRFVL